jgi:hypothetical protein
MARGIDWEAVRRDWEITPRITSRELGERYGCSHTAINKKIAAEGWQKNLANEVQNRAKEILATDGTLSAGDRERVEEAAQKVVDVARTHRAALRIQAGLVDRLNAEIAKKLDKFESNPWGKIDELNRLTEMMERLTRALVRLVEMERKAHGLDAPEEGGSKGLDAAARTNEDRIRRLRELFGPAGSGMASDGDA